MPLVSGTICLWSGAVGSIPSGWRLCDGTAGTPDLRDRFIIGAGGTLSPGDVGGANTHTHSFTSDSHVHAILPGTQIKAGADYNNFTTANPDTGNTDPSNHFPPFYTLAFIMRV